MSCTYRFMSDRTDYYFSHHPCFQENSIQMKAVCQDKEKEITQDVYCVTVLCTATTVSPAHSLATHSVATQHLRPSGSPVVCPR